ncbi:hypothetical protein HAX54_025099, partial [Datura stramonium]|nr:hypothetical protein [Datura stramonium]
KDQEDNYEMPIKTREIKFQHCSLGRCSSAGRGIPGRQSIPSGHDPQRTKKHRVPGNGLEAHTLSSRLACLSA